MTLFAATTAFFVFILVVIGNYAGRRVKTLEDYYVAGRRAPTFLIIGTLVASNMSTTVFMGEAGFTYAGQLGPYLLLPGLPVTGYVFGALFFGTYLRRSRATTVAAFFGERFASPEVQRIAGWTVILGLGGYLLVVTQGAALLLSDLTGVSYAEGVLIAWLSYSTFTLYAGSKGVVITDTLMFLLFTAASFFVVVHLVDGFGGISQTIQDLTRQDVKPGLMSWHGIIGDGTPWPTALDFLIWFVLIDLSWSLVYAVSPWQSSRHLMAKSEHVVLRASIYTVLVVIFLQIAIYGAGGFVNLANPDIENEETVLIWAAMNLVPSYLGAILVAGIVCAALSSASTFLSLVGFSVSKDLGIQNTAASLGRTRTAMALISLVVLGLSLFLPHNLFWITLFIGTVFASSWGPVGLMSICSRSITARGARWGMLAGLLANIVPAALDYIGLIDLPSYMEPVLLGIIASVLFARLGSRGDVVSEAERDYRTQLHQTPSVDVDRRATRITLLAPALLIAYGCLMPFLLLQFYVEPYQLGAGIIELGESIDWHHAEPWFVIGPLIIHVPLGVIAWRVIRRRYSPSASIAPTSQA